MLTVIADCLADEALLASISVRADLAHLAERITDVQRSSAVHVPGGPIGPLKTGVCYLMGEWGGYTLSFTSGPDVALLVVESFNPELSLAEFFEKLSIQPLMHARLVCRETDDGQIEPLLVYPGVDEQKHKLLNIAEQNAVLMMRKEPGGTCEVIKVESEAVVGRSGFLFRLTYLPTPHFQNVLVWCLPPKTGRGAEPDPTGSTTACQSKMETDQRLAPLAVNPGSAVPRESPWPHAECDEIRISIPPMTIEQAPASVILPDGALSCLFHAEIVGTFRCQQCGAVFCASCVRSLRRISGGALYFCPVCPNAQCTKIAGRPRLVRRGERIRQWLGKMLRVVVLV